MKSYTSIFNIPNIHKVVLLNVLIVWIEVPDQIVFELDNVFLFYMWIFSPILIEVLIRLCFNLILYVYVCGFFFLINGVMKLPGFWGGISGKEPTCQCRRPKRCRFGPWVRTVPWRRAWQPTSIFLPGQSSWTEEPGRLQSTGLRRVGHDWSNLACTHETSQENFQKCS